MNWISWIYWPLFVLFEVASGSEDDGGYVKLPSGLRKLGQKKLGKLTEKFSPSFDDKELGTKPSNQRDHVKEYVDEPSEEASDDSVDASGYSPFTVDKVTSASNLPAGYSDTNLDIADKGSSEESIAIETDDESEGKDTIVYGIAKPPSETAILEVLFEGSCNACLTMDVGPEKGQLGPVYAGDSEDCTSCIRIRERLGNGKFGTVYKGNHVQDPVACVPKKQRLKKREKNLKADSIDYAIKVLDLSEADKAKNSEWIWGAIRREAYLALVLNHPNVLKGVCWQEERIQNKNYAVFMMQYYPNGNLWENIERREKENRKVTATEILKWTRDILKGLEAIHSLGVVHGDVRSPNIVLDENNNAVIVDLGVTIPMGSVLGLASMPILHRSPESFSSRSFPTEAWDYWSLGVLLHQLVTDDYPFDIDPEKQDFWAKFSRNLVFRKELFTTIPFLDSPSWSFSLEDTKQNEENMMREAISAFLTYEPDERMKKTKKFIKKLDNFLGK